MEWQIIFGSIAVILGLFQYLPYAFDVFRGKTKPHAFSWFAWGLPTGIILFAQIADGGGAGVWATGVTALLCTLIFILSLFRGERNIVFIDWVSLSCSVVAIAAWTVTSDPLWAVILVTATDLFGFVPTIRKSVLKPEEETITTYIVGGSKWIFSMMALNTFSAVTLIYPLAMVIANWGFAVMLKVRRTTLHSTL